MPKIKVQKEKIPTPYAVAFDFDGLVLKGKGATLVDALNKIAPKFTIKTKVIVTAKYGKKSSMRTFRPFEVKRLLLNNFNKQVFSKRMLSFMK